jgi:hypothetical protein
MTDIFYLFLLLRRYKILNGYQFFYNYLCIFQLILRGYICPFFRQNGGEGFYEGKENLIPQLFNNLLWIVSAGLLLSREALQELGIEEFRIEDHREGRILRPIGGIDFDVINGEICGEN